MTDATDTILTTQLAYYRARADEYDQWWLRRGRYDRGTEATRRWFREAVAVQEALERFSPGGDVLELAGGTGIWTERLVRTAGTLTVVDGAPEMLRGNEERVPDSRIERVHADLFKWQPLRQYDVVFFGFWLSHVPEEWFERFWSLVAKCLRPGGRFFLVDSLRTPSSTAVNHVLPPVEEPVMTRRLDDGREFRVYKVFRDAGELTARLTAMGWHSEIHATDNYFLYGWGEKPTE